MAAACLLALVVVIGASLPRVTFDDDIHRVFLSDSPLSEAQRAYEHSQSPQLSTVLLHITAPAPFSAETLTALRNLALDLEFVDGVNAVTSPFVLRWPPQTDGGVGRPVFEQIISESYAQDVADFEALGTGLPTFLNAALTGLLISVSVDVGQIDLARATMQIRSELDRGLPPSLSVQITGEDVISAEIVTGLKDDLIALNLWGALIVTLAAYVLLRDVRMALLAVLPALLGAAGVMALSVWLAYPITVLSNVIPILLLVLGVADGVHLTGHFKRTGSLKSAITQVGPACALTALTTAVAFASIMLTGNAQLYEFAVLGAIGTLYAFVAVIVAFAVLGRAMRLSHHAVPGMTATIATRLTGLGVRRPQATVAACAALLLISVFGFSQTKAWFPLYQNLPDNSPTVATNDAIARDFGGVFQMIVQTDAPWEEFRDMVQAVEAQAPPKTVLSELNLARWLGDANTQPTEEDLQRLPDALVSQLRGPDGAARIFVSVPEPMRNDAALAYFDTLQATATQARAHNIIGLPTIMRHEAVRLIDQLSIGLLMAASGATLLVALAFRSLRLVPIIALPNVLPLTVTAASLHLWADGALSPTAVLALTIAFGIAIDDTVHFLSRFAAARTAGQRPGEALRSATASAGQVIVLTTLLLTAGLCVTLVSDFTPIRLFGGMMIITLWAALLIDLMLLPALLSWKGRNDERA